MQLQTKPGTFMNSRELLDIGQSRRQERTKDTLEVGFCFCGIPAGIQEKDLVRAVALDRPHGL